MMTRVSVSTLVAWALLATSGALTAWNWSLQPDRGPVWLAAAVLLLVMTIASALAARVTAGGPPREAAAAIQQAVAFAGLVMTVSLGAKLAREFGVIDGTELGRRSVMAVIGISLVFTGNTLPKTLTPLSALRCDPARVQAFQRFAGWTWVLAGLAFALAWIVLPVGVAQPVSLSLLAASMLVVGARLVGLRRQREA
jgi:hypothetical protein